MATNIIDKVLHIDAELINETSLNANIKIDDVYLDSSIEMGSGGKLPYYKGDYEIKPKAYEDIILPTKEKSMKEDVKVLVIPTDTVSNAYGYTFAIARERIEIENV